MSKSGVPRAGAGGCKKHSGGSVQGRWANVGDKEDGKIRNLRFASANLDSLNNWEALPYQRSLLRDLFRDADIICVQETKLLGTDEDAFLRTFKGQAVFSAAPQDRGSKDRSTTGVAILFTSTILAQGLAVREGTRKADSEGRWVSVEIGWNSQSYTVMSLYAPAAAEERIQFYRSLSAVMEAEGVGRSRLIVLGDFNAVLDGRLDRQNPLPLRVGTGHDELRDWMQHQGLIDVWRRDHPLAREYTGPKRTFFSRIDLGLVASEISDRFGGSMEIRRCPSRHRVIGLNLLDKAGAPWARGPPPFKIRNWMLEDEKFCRLILAAAEDSVNTNMALPSVVEQYEQVKLDIISAAQGLAYQLAAEEKEEAEACRAELHELHRTRRMLLKPTYRGKDESDLLDRLHKHRLRRDDKIALIVGGLKRHTTDRPSKDFLRKMNSHSNRTAFRAVRTREGRLVTSLPEMAEALREFWATVSHSPDVGCVKPPRDQQAWDRLLSNVTPVLTEVEIITLGAPISLAELAPKRNEAGVIIDAGILRSLPRGKSGGVDGWSYEFIQLLWPVIGPLMVQGWNAAWTGKQRLPGGGHLALLHLLLKPSKNVQEVTDPTLPESYRPLSLLNCDGKLLSRILVQRLLKVIERLIHKDQTGFIPGRSIEANVRIQHDFTHFFENMDAKEFEEDGTYAGGVGRMDHDFEKAYDSLDVDFMLAVCEKFGLGRGFVDWVRVFYRDAQTAVLVNGYRSSPYRLTYGARQGDPLSPLLFDLVMETLALLVRSSAELQSVELPAGPGWEPCLLRITLYADDFNHYFRGSRSIIEFRKILQCFRLAANLKTKAKAEVGMWWGPPLSVEARGASRWLEGEDFDVALGVRFGKKVSAEVMCEPVQVRLHKAINSLEGLCWTPYGRAVLAQSLVVPIVVYWARVIVIPDAMITSMQAAIMKFVWKNYYRKNQQARSKKPEKRVQHLVGDKGVLRRRADGGLPLQHLESVVKANQVSFILRLLSPAQQTYKALPRFWVSNVGFPYNLGFSHLFSSQDLCLPPDAPLFYRKCVTEFRALPWTMDAPTSMGELGNLPLWRNRQLGCLEPTRYPMMAALAAAGIRYIGQLLSPMTWKIPNTLPADLEGLQRYPSALPMTLELSSRMLVSSKIQGLITASKLASATTSPRQLPLETALIITFEGTKAGNTHQPVVWQVKLGSGPGAVWEGCQLQADIQGRWAQRGEERQFTQEQVRHSTRLSRSPEGVVWNTCGAGDTNIEHLSLQTPNKTSRPAIECKVRDFYQNINRGWHGSLGAPAGLTRMIEWVESTGYTMRWLPATCRGIRTTSITAEERNLLWLVLHSAVRLGYRRLSELRVSTEEMTVVERAGRRDQCNCPICGFGARVAQAPQHDVEWGARGVREEEAPDEGETLDHAFGTCCELGIFWDWVVTTFLPLVGAQCAAPRSASAAHLVGEGSPAVLAGLLGLIVNTRPTVGITAVDQARNIRYLHAWWALVRGTALRVVDRYRRICRKHFEDHGVRFARPGLHVLQEDVRSGLRARIVEEVAAVRCGKLTKGDVGLGPPGRKILATGVLLDGALGYLPDGRTEVVFSLVLGGQSAGRPIRGGRVQGGAGATPAHIMARGVLRGRRGVINFDGASKNNPGRAGCAATLSTWEIPHAQVAEDSEFMGIQTNNVAEYAGMILGLRLAQTHGLTRVEVRGDSRLVINQMAHGWACRKLILIRLQGIARRLITGFDDGVAFKWVAREQNKQADKLADDQTKNQDAQFTRRELFFPET